MNQKGFANIVLIVIVVAIVAVGGYFILNREPKITQQTTTPSETKQTQTSPVLEGETANWTTYRNDKHGFEFKYPQEWFQQNVGVDGGDDPYRFGTFQTDQSPNVPQNGLYGPSISFWITDLVVGPYNKVTKDEFVQELTKSHTYRWTKINGFDALRTEKSNKGADINNTIINYYFFKGDKIYKLGFLHDDNNSTLDKYLNQFETLVSTFKFIN